MRIIVTGGTGLIGSQLIESLEKDGHEVIVLSRSPGNYTFPKGVRCERWDGRTAENWGYLADGADAIINLAGESIAGTGLIPSRWTSSRKSRILESRLNAGQAVVDAVKAAKTKPRLVIQSSGIDYYGDRRDEIITENSSAGGESFLSKVTLDWEASTAAVEEMGVRRIIIRSGLVLTMESGPLSIIVLPFRFFVGGPVGAGRQWLSWIHLEDEIRAIRFLLENESASGPFNLCAPNPLTYQDLARSISRVLKRPSYIPVPGFALRLALGEIAELIIHGRRAIPDRLTELGFTFHFPDIESALTSLLKS